MELEHEKAVYDIGNNKSQLILNVKGYLETGSRAQNQNPK